MKMTQEEEKSILLKDLCARLPYGVKFALNTNTYTAEGVDLIVTDEGDWEYAVTTKCSEPIEIKYIKPYLRSMSSMTEEEKEEYCNLQDGFLYSNKYPVTDSYAIFDWLNKKMFTYRTLDGKDMFELGLALEAPEGMYNINN